jgi:hypothetical protein
VLAEILRLPAELDPQIIWVFIFTAATVTVFVVYIGIAIWATLHATDAEERKIRYQIFRDLLGLFRRERHK